MHNQLIQMYYSGAANEAAATIDVPDDGVIKAVFFSLIAGDIAIDGDLLRAQLSFGSTRAMTSNDARQVICNAAMQFELVGAGANLLNSSMHKEIYFDDGISVQGGERLYLHFLAGGTPPAVDICYCDILFAFKGTGTVASRRR